jgi:predicted HicB family RNase H-like nuclease
MYKKLKSDLMFYKDFYGTVHYSADDELFYGRLEGINDSITFEGTTVKELKSAFEEAVDDYLEICKELNKEPQKPYKGSFNVRIDPELHRKLAIKAIEEGVSLNQVVEEAIKKAV